MVHEWLEKKKVYTTFCLSYYYEENELSYSGQWSLTNKL